MIVGLKFLRSQKNEKMQIDLRLERSNHIYNFNTAAIPFKCTLSLKKLDFKIFWFITLRMKNKSNCLVDRGYFHYQF